MGKSCYLVNEFSMFLVSGLYEDGITVSFCCVGSTYKGYKIPGVMFDETPEKTMSNFIALRKKLLEEATISKNEINDKRISSLCEGCSLYQDINMEPSKKIGRISYNIYPAPCNIKCIYCYSCIKHHSNQNSKFDYELHKPIYEKYFELLEYARNSGLISDNALYEVAPGEIAVNPFKDRILDFVKGQATHFLTNCVKYNDKIARNLAENIQSLILTSLDAGTAGTWKRVKGADNFDKTIRNIESYVSKAIHPKQIKVKYIIQPGINTNAKDYEGITKLVQRLGINHIVIALDIVPRTQKHLDVSIQAASELLAVMNSKGVSVSWNAFPEAALKKIVEITDSVNVPSSTAIKKKPTVQLEKTISKSDVGPIRTRLQEASDLMNVESFEEAGKIFMELTSYQEVAPIAFYYLARLSNLTNDPITAKNLYYKAFELMPNICSVMFPKEHANIGYIYTKPENEEKIDSCPLCEKTDCIPRWCYCLLELNSLHVRYYNPIRTWMYCEDCHHMFAEEFPSQKTSASSGLQLAGEVIQTNVDRFQFDSDILCRLINLSSGNDLLEIGSGGSEFALAAREMGFNVLALDVSEGNVNQALKYGLDARVQDIMTYVSDKKWDVITMGDVIEHVACPVKTIEKVSGLLANNGVFWLSTPNFESSFSFAKGHDDKMRREVAHKNYFSRESLFALLARFDLAPVDYRVSGRFNGCMEVTAVSKSRYEVMQS